MVFVQCVHRTRPNNDSYASIPDECKMGFVHYRLLMTLFRPFPFIFECGLFINMFVNG